MVAKSSMQTGMITGQIVSVDTVPIPGVRVSIARSNLIATTDRFGSFEIRHGLSGTQELVLAISGYEIPIIPPLRLSASDTLRFNAFLQKPLPPGRALDSSLRVQRRMRGLGANLSVPMIAIDGNLVLDNPTSRGVRRDAVSTTIDIAGADYLPPSMTKRFGDLGTVGILFLTRKR